MKTMTRDEYNGQGHSALWWIARVLGTVLVFGTIAILLWRVFTSGDPKEISTITPNRAVCDAYRAAQAEGKPLTIYSTEQLKYTSVQNKNYGYFFITDSMIIEEADQIQLVFRYNNSTIRHLKEDYALETMPDRSEDLYDVTLYIAYDLTPGDSTDNDGNDPASVRFVRYHPTSCTSDEKNLYNYRRFVFDGIDMNVDETPVLGVYVDFYYKGDTDYEKEPYGTLMIYDYSAERIPYELTRADIAALEGFSETD